MTPMGVGEDNGIQFISDPKQTLAAVQVPVKVAQQKPLACEQIHPFKVISSKNILFERIQIDML